MPNRGNGDEIDDGIPVDHDNPVIPVVDTNGKLLGNLTWVQRYVGRTEIPLPHQVLFSFGGGGEAKRMFHYIWTMVFQRPLSWLKDAEPDHHHRPHDG